MKGQSRHESDREIAWQAGCQYLGRVPKTGSVVTWEQETPTYKQTGRKSKWKRDALAAADEVCLGWRTSNSNIQGKYELGNI